MLNYRAYINPYRSTTQWIIVAASTLLATACVTRPDDHFEKNNTLTQATLLTPGITIEARVNQGDPDVFKIHASKGELLIFELESRGLENCPAFSLTAPNKDILYAEKYNRCHMPSLVEIQSDNVNIDPDNGKNAEHYSLTVQVKTSGIYYLTIDERKEADNLFPFSWDYRLSAYVQ